MKVNDIFGIEPISEATKNVVQTGLQGISSFMRLLFKPGMEELGLLLKDKVRYWRLNNIISIMDKAQKRLNFDGENLQLQANARVGFEIIEEGSKIEDSELQEMWAGLFISSCSEDGKDDSNIIFIDLLKRISKIEARILKYACENCEIIEEANLIMSNHLAISLSTLMDITQSHDIVLLDRVVDHMLSLSLLQDGDFIDTYGGFKIENGEISSIGITPTALALNLFYKTNAVNQTPKEFWSSRSEN